MLRNAERVVVKKLFVHFFFANVIQMSIFLVIFYCSVAVM